MKNTKRVMKKFLFALLAVMFCLSCLIVPVSADETGDLLTGAASPEPALLFDFTQKRNDYALTASNNVEFVYNEAEKAYKYTSVSGPDVDPENVGDPYITYGLTTPLDAANKYISVCFKNESEAIEFEMHYGKTGGAVAAQNCVHYKMQDTKDYQTLVFDVKQANIDTMPLNELDPSTPSEWEGTISEIRLDILWKAEKSGQMPSGSTCYLKWVAFFASEEDAKAYTGPVSSGESTEASGTIDAGEATGTTVAGGATGTTSAGEATGTTSAGEATGTTNANSTTNPTTKSTSGTSSAESDDGASPVIWIVIGVAVVVIIVVIVVIVKKKK